MVSAEESLPAAVVCSNLCSQWSEFTSVCIHREVWDSRFGVERQPPHCFYMPPTHLLVKFLELMWEAVLARTYTLSLPDIQKHVEFAMEITFS